MTATLGSPAMGEFLEAVRAALDVPGPAHHADDLYRDVLVFRAVAVRVAVNSLHWGACDNTALRTETMALRQTVAASPVTYQTVPPHRVAS
jgi:hypothetical protein